MKLLLIPAFFAVSATGFAPSYHAFHTVRDGFRFGTSLNERIDSSEAVANALKASKEFGPTSKEARVAWDIVEELDSSDNTSAYEGGESSDYEEKVAALSDILSESKEKVQQIKSMVSEIKSMKISRPASAQSPDSEAMQAALNEARALSEEYGPDSKEAKIAWETVEEIAASDNSQAYAGTIDEECLVETLEACEALEEITKAVAMDRE